MSALSKLDLPPFKHGGDTRVSAIPYLANLTVCSRVAETRGLWQANDDHNLWQP